MVVETVEYQSSVDATGPLVADVAFEPDGKSKPVVLLMPGYTDSRVRLSEDIVEWGSRGIFAITPDMRGLGDSSGEFDSGGLDVHDAVDAIGAVAKLWPDEIDTTNCSAAGYSGGGGNVFSMAVRFPDTFKVIAPFFGISDYGAWYRSRREAYGAIMDSAIGPPDEFPECYEARNATAAAGNNAVSYIHVFWDIEEESCPPFLNERFIEAYRAAGHSRVFPHISNPGDAIRWHHGYPSQFPELREANDMILADVFRQENRPSLPERGELTVPGYLVTRHFSVWVEDGLRGRVKIAYDLTGDSPLVEVVENPGDWQVRIKKIAVSQRWPLHKQVVKSRA